MSKEPTPRVELQSIFVRDLQRRLSLVIDLLTEEFRLQPPSPQLPAPRPVKRRSRREPLQSLRPEVHT